MQLCDKSKRRDYEEMRIDEIKVGNDWDKGDIETKAADKDSTGDVSGCKGCIIELLFKMENGIMW